VALAAGSVVGFWALVVSCCCMRDAAGAVAAAVLGRAVPTKPSKVICRIKEVVEYARMEVAGLSDAVRRSRFAPVGVYQRRGYPAAHCSATVPGGGGKKRGPFRNTGKSLYWIEGR
jgi:hypothetical protein